MLVKKPKNKIQATRALLSPRMQLGQHENLVHIFLMGIFQTLDGERDLINYLQTLPRNLGNEKIATCLGFELYSHVHYIKAARDRL